MTTTPTETTALETIELAPSYRLPIGTLLLGLAIGFLNIWVGGVIALFGIFLMIQAATLRLRFSPTDLDVYRGENRIRQFPYADWQNWEIFWQPVPILFYFKEIKSIHFVPVLFNPKTLRECLEQRCSPEL
ncbi:DUF3119 family protein [Vacuolonema iberomarrocanum]|uniref:DUF3119 family protein n=1 Tax=Vacuolonema iberomarrocanum TaxID=3454632 RepID=UPI0019DAEA81|nr:DUF3119 family protein [filamentous cyanobacterium LEGE 07170]